MKIGITISQKAPGDSMWSNGIKLNALILQKMLKNSSRNHEVYLVNREPIELDSTTPWDIVKYPCISLEKAQQEMDLILIVGAALSDEWIKEFKAIDPNRRVVAYHCGNHYILEMENVLFKENKSTNRPNWNLEIDANWLIPQQEYHNFYYVQTFTRKPTVVVPFVWDSEFVDKVSDTMKASGTYNPVEYVPGRPQKRISVFEPNINCIKYAMIPIHITEWAYRTPIGKSLLDYLSVTNGKDLMANHEFTGHLKYLDIVKEKKIFMESRYNTPYFLAEHTDIVLSHQWGNPLNYAYLDALHFGYPLVHNADMIKDMGYFYNDFNILSGAEQLLKALSEHDLHHEEYKRRSAFALNRYRATNNSLSDLYDKLIDELFETKDWDLSYEYDWKTNKYF
jgi:hypothetical protein